MLVDYSQDEETIQGQEMTNIITEAINAVGGSGADWQVQALGAVALVMVGAGYWVTKRWQRKRKAKK